MKLISIGQFSQMTRLSSKALRLYDEKGLLSPAHVDPESGYRYYTLTQANRAEAVRILRSVDMPLNEIKAVLAADNDELFHKQLAVHRDRLAERLAADERMLEYLESLIKRKEGIMPYTVQIEQVTSQLIAATRVHTTLAKVGQNVGGGFARLMPALAQAGIPPSGPPLTIQPDIIDEETDGDIEICVPIDAEFVGNDETYSRELAACSVATTVHHGRYQEIRPAYHTLTGWIAEHGHEIIGPPREIYLNDPQTVAPDDLRTRVEIPIRVADSSTTPNP